MKQITIDYWDKENDLCSITVNSRQEAINEVNDLQNKGYHVICWFFTESLVDDGTVLNDNDMFSIGELIVN